MDWQSAVVMKMNFYSNRLFKTVLSVGNNGDDSAFDVFLSDNNFAYTIGEFEQKTVFFVSIF